MNINEKIVEIIGKYNNLSICPFVHRERERKINEKTISCLAVVTVVYYDDWKGGEKIVIPSHNETVWKYNILIECSSIEDIVEPIIVKCLSIEDIGTPIEKMLDCCLYISLNEAYEVKDGIIIDVMEKGKKVISEVTGEEYEDVPFDPLSIYK